MLTLGDPRPDGHGSVRFSRRPATMRNADRCRQGMTSGSKASGFIALGGREA